MLISIVVPIYNEQNNIPEVYRSITSALDAAFAEYEIIMVDDNRPTFAEINHTILRGTFQVLRTSIPPYPVFAVSACG